MLGYILFFSMMTFIFYELFLNPEVSLLKSRPERMRAIMLNKEKKGITMSKNWTYKAEDGTLHRSPTGREKDCSCGGIRKHHPGLYGDVELDELDYSYSEPIQNNKRRYKSAGLRTDRKKT